MLLSGLSPPGSWSNSFPGSYGLSEGDLKLVFHCTNSAVMEAELLIYT